MVVFLRSCLPFFKKLLFFMWPEHTCTTAQLWSSQDSSGVSFAFLARGLQGQNAGHLAWLQGASAHGALSLGRLVVSDEVTTGWNSLHNLVRLVSIIFLPLSPHDGITSGDEHTRLFLHGCWLSEFRFLYGKHLPTGPSPQPNTPDFSAQCLQL